MPLPPDIEIETVADQMDETGSRAVKECSALIESCAESGEYINPYSADDLAKKEACTNSRLFTERNSEGDLLGCLLMTDKDHCAEGLEGKSFLLDEISRIEGVDLSEEATKVFWISSVCTSPSARRSGCASRLFALADEAAFSHPSEYIIIAEAVRSVNDEMLRFSEHRGYKRFDEPLTEETFGLPLAPDSIPWVVLYKFLRRPS